MIYIFSETRPRSDHVWGGVPEVTTSGAASHTWSHLGRALKVVYFSSRGARAMLRGARGVGARVLRGPCRGGSAWRSLDAARPLGATPLDWQFCRAFQDRQETSSQSSYWALGGALGLGASIGSAQCADQATGEGAAVHNEEDTHVSSRLAAPRVPTPVPRTGSGLRRLEACLTTRESAHVRQSLHSSSRH